MARLTLDIAVQKHADISMKEKKKQGLRFLADLGFLMIPTGYVRLFAMRLKGDLARARMPKMREDVAALTKTVAACAEQGCKTAQEILKENGKEIDRLIALAARRIGKQNVKAVINGGITNCKRFWMLKLGVQTKLFLSTTALTRRLKIQWRKGKRSIPCIR